MMVDSLLDDTQTPIKAPSLSSSTWTASQIQGIRQLTQCSQDTDDLTTPTQDEFTTWILTASQKKLQRESKLQRQAPSNRHSNINTLETEDNLTLKGQFSDDDDDDDSGDDDDSNDSNECDMDTIKQGTANTQDDKGTRQRRRKLIQLDLQAALDSYEKHCDMNEAAISNHTAAATQRNRKNQTRRRHTSLPATAPTRLPTPKLSSIHGLKSGHISSSSHPTSTFDSITLSQHKQQQLATTSWLDFDPYDTNIISIEQEQQPKRRPISMISSSFGTTGTHHYQGKTDHQVVDLEAFLSRGPLKCNGKDKDTLVISCKADTKSPKISSNQNTTTTRIPLPVNKKPGSNINKPASWNHHHQPLSTSKISTSQPYTQQSGVGDGAELRRRPSLMSSDSLMDQQKQLEQHLDINLVSVQGELCVPDGISQQRQQQQHHVPPLPSTTLPQDRPILQRVSSLHERLQELAHDDTAWNEITKPTIEKRTEILRGNRKYGISSHQHATGISSIRKQQTKPSSSSLQQKGHSPSITSPSASSPPVPRPAMSPPTAYKLYKPLLTPFEQQEILNYPQIYFVGNHAKNKYRATMDRHHGNYGYDDGRGDYMMVPRDHLGYRYEMLEIMGKGSFGQVIKAFDHKQGSIVAVKIIRNRKRFHAQALVEVKTLEDLLKWDPDDKHNNVRMTDNFYFRNHLCIAFECLDINLYDFMKGNHFQGFSMGLIRRFTIQLLNSLVLLHQHHLIHCDLKPENVLLKDSTKSTIKVIDFGSSCLENEKVYTYIQSRFYRAPEVMLGLEYGVEIDMWSVGCILAELYTGSPLFPGENEQDQLACIMEIQGVPSLSIVEKCTRRKLFFDAYGNPKLTINSKGKKRRPDTKSLADVLKCSDAKFVDFIDRCLQWNPSDRIKSEEAFKHGWIARQQPPIQQS